MPSQDMIIGTYYLTSDPDPAVEVERDAEGNEIVPAFSSFAEAVMAYDFGKLPRQRRLRHPLRGGHRRSRGLAVARGLE